MKQLYVTCTCFFAILSAVCYFSGLVYLFFIFVFLMIGSIIMTNIQASKDAKEMVENNLNLLDEVLSEHNIVKSQLFTDINQDNAIILDEENELLIIAKKNNANFNLLKFPLNKIVESQIIEDGISITKTSRSSQIGGALVGSVLTGGSAVGAIIGGLSGTKTTHDIVQTVILQIVIDDLNNPVQKVVFMDSKTPIKKDNILYKATHEKAIHWHKLLSVIIKRYENTKQLNHN